MDARFLIDRPELTDLKDPEGFILYREADGTLLKWSGGRMELPKVGQRIKITMNNIGPAVVKGHFAEAGFVGVMTKPTKPPEWLKRQRREDQKRKDRPQWVKDGIGCEFGTEIAPR